MRQLLVDTFVHLPPLKMLEDLSAIDAMRAPAPGMHSIAQIVAHLDYWQQWFLLRCAGQEVPMAASATDGWPAVTASDWPALLERFAAGLQRAVQLAEDTAALDQPLSPPVDFPLLATFTRRDALVHVAQHNSHHLGQVISARQVLGLWPPRAGSWTW